LLSTGLSFKKIDKDSNAIDGELNGEKKKEEASHHHPW
jgi:hypothetical protein